MSLCQVSLVQRNCCTGFVVPFVPFLTSAVAFALSTESLSALILFVEGGAGYILTISERLLTYNNDHISCWCAGILAQHHLTGVQEVQNAIAEATAPAPPSADSGTVSGSASVLCFLPQPANDLQMVICSLVTYMLVLVSNFLADAITMSCQHH